MVGGAQIYCKFDVDVVTAPNIKSALTAHPLRFNAASTRQPEDWVLIDELICCNLGAGGYGVSPFQEFGECITDAMPADAAVYTEKTISEFCDADGLMDLHLQAPHRAQ